MQCLEYHGTPPNHLVFVAGVECVGVFGFLMFLSVVLRWGHALSLPNPEAKPIRADGTALGRVWESRSPPASQPKK